jgi:ribosomal protein L9
MKKIINVETGEVIERELNAEEIAQQEIDEIKSAEKLAKQLQEEAPQIAAKALAEGKLTALGLTTEDLKALGLGGN